MNRIFTSILLVFFVFGLSAQSFDANALTKDFLSTNIDQLDLSQSDIENYQITDMYQTKHNGVTHVYMVQTYQGIQVYNAMINLNITKEGKVPFYGNRFVKDLESKIESSSFSIPAEDAIYAFAEELGIASRAPLKLKKKTNEHVFIYEQPSFAEDDLKVEKKFFLTAEGSVIPTWEVTSKMKGNADHWNTRVSAIDGIVVDKFNYTVYCHHAKGKYAKHHNHNCSDSHTTETIGAKASAKSARLMGAMYRVYPFPGESAQHIAHELITDPHNPDASPFGWHDVNGIEGPEYTYTRGNNVHAVLDIDENTGETLSEGPDGGEELIFDNPHLVDLEPSDSQPAVISNMFYINNMMHDRTYRFGFDEAAGNFQDNTYGNIGFGGDHVIAEAIDASGTNNASFGTPPDGQNGSMNMFLWDIVRNSLVNISEPIELAGSYDYGSVVENEWGFANYDAFDVTGDIVIAFDNLPQGATQCCNDIVNDTEVAGKIALIDRGGCEFGSKARNAQSNGAIACIICNVAGVNGGDGDELNLQMSAGNDGTVVSIPTFMLRKTDCDLIRASINSGADVSMTIKPIVTAGPDQLPSAFDNGIIAHEYAHGISTRLTGGPSSVGCLGNAEAMGEGWSDLFALFYTVEEGDTGEMARGIGTYVLGEPTTGRGIRRVPFSTDLSINSQSYDDIKGQTGPWPIGEVWVAACWDMYWAMVDKYGYDADWNNTESGNFKAVQLVVDGMKFQSCNPGYTDGRDAIIGADFVNNNGENNCLIWDAFARRGLGIMTNQGSTSDVNDGTEDFSPLATCIKEIKIDKTASDFINPGELIEVSLLIRNHTLDAKNNVIVTDELNDKVSYVDGSGSLEPTITGNTLSWNLATMESLDEITITYSIQTESADQSVSLFYDDLESGPANFNLDLAQGTNIWGLTGLDARSGSTSWFIEDVYVDAGGFNEGGDTRLILNEMEVVGERPALRFWHKYDTESGVDGGFVEISTDGGSTWRNVTDDMFRNPYNSILSYQTLAIPSLNAFTGTNNTEWVDSYIDLSDYKGENVTFRFRYGTDGLNSSNTAAWYLDDLEILDILEHTFEACVQADDGSNACSSSKTIINSNLSSGLEDEILASNIALDIFPNPTSDYASIKLASDGSYDVKLSILSMDGKQLISEQVSLNNSVEIVTVNTTDYPKGFYLVRLESGQALITKKLIIQ